MEGGREDSFPTRRDGRAKRVNKRARKKTHLPAHRTEEETLKSQAGIRASPTRGQTGGALAFWRSGVLARPITT